MRIKINVKQVFFLPSESDNFSNKIPQPREVSEYDRTCKLRYRETSRILTEFSLELASSRELATKPSLIYVLTLFHLRLLALH